jgi:ferredoxin
MGRFALWRVGKASAECRDCGLCEQHCQGACQPAGELRHSECILCLNCLDSCRDEQITFSHQVSAAGERPLPDLARRGVVLSLVSGLATAPLLRADGSLAGGYNPDVVRPPGALPEAEFLARCTKCGQCMRICPSNVIQPAGLQAGLEGLWTPLLDFRIGTSGCQFNCVACGHLCPTAAIRPLSLAERMGLGDFTGQGPVRIGTAFIDRGRCLPWAMDRPCIVCQENCPVSPKAIYTQAVFSPLRFGRQKATSQGPDAVQLTGPERPNAPLGSGDYFCRPVGAPVEARRRIIADQEGLLNLSPAPAWPEGLAQGGVVIEVRLQRPVMDPARCIGCGVCQHECPVSGRPAIRVSAENESRAGRPAFL